MGDFGWAYLSGAVTGEGPTKSIQYLKQLDGEITGSSNFTFDQASSHMYLTGTLKVSGTISAHTFDVVHTNKIELQTSGSTNFGNDSGDTHVFTGSIAIVSGSFRSHYYRVTGSNYTAASYDSIIGVSASTAVLIQLPTAAIAGAGRRIIIKDEWEATRAEGTAITVSASSGQTIDHAAFYAISGDSAALTLYSDGLTKWFIF